MKQILFIFTFLLPVCVYPQLRESFDGPELTTAYSWAGDLERFRINEEKELQLHGIYYKDAVRMYLSTVPLWDNEWRFKVRSKYQGTYSNCFKFYLSCESPDMESPGDAILVRVGYSKKTVDLCYQQNNISTKVLLAGRALCSGAHEVEVKVVTDVNGLCTLYTRVPGEAEYYKEGTVELPLNPMKGYFMMGVIHSSEHNRDKYVDDVYIRQFIPKGEEPAKALTLLSLEQKSEKELFLYFNQRVVADYASFTLSGLGESEDIFISEDETTLKLTWEGSMEKDRPYELKYTDLYDMGGAAYSGTYTFTSVYGAGSPGEPEEPSAFPVGSVRINEVMADPKGLSQLPETEYIEIYNTTPEAIPLADWTLVYGETPVALANQALPAYSYLVVLREGRDIHVDSKGYVMPLEKFPSQLANTGKELQLLDPTAAVIDQYAYANATPARSWERGEIAWHLSTDSKGGTPGTANSAPEGEIPQEPEEPNPPTGPVIHANDIVFNELLPEPNPEGSEYIELYNRSDQSLLLTGLSIATRRQDGSLYTCYALSAITDWLAPGDYILLTEDKAGVDRYYSIESPEKLYEVKLPALSNTSSTLVLIRTEDQTVIDEVAYSDKWHDEAVRDKKGIALERIDPDAASQNPDNWISASFVAGCGTPGSRNSQMGIPGRPDGIQKPRYSDETGLYSIRYELDQPGYKCKAYVYDLSGRRVAQVANNELVGTSGEMFWDGNGLREERLRPGPYIFYMELYNAQGYTKKYKETFLIH